MHRKKDGVQMLKQISLVAGAALMACAAPASATTLLTFSPAGQPNTGLDGPDGNVRTYSVVAEGQTVTVRARGWTIDNNTLRAAFLGTYSNGLGVTNSLEGNGSGNTHTVDNSGTVDLVTFEFDRAVSLKSMFLSAYGDTDAQILWGNATSAQVAALGNQPVATASALLLGSFMSNGTNTSGNRTLDLGNATGNLWAISTGNFVDTTPDAFKIRSIGFTLAPTAAVPEPSTWAMLLLGFFGVGGLMRRRQQPVLTYA